MSSDPHHLVINGQDLTIGDVARVARSPLEVQLTSDRGVTAAVRGSCAYIRNATRAGARIYGVTTGYGAMADVEIAPNEVADLQSGLVWLLTTSTGRRVGGDEVRAAMLIRANSHLRGASGIGLELVRRLEAFLNNGVTPHVREFGSIGASGDLVPLASITGALIGLDPAFRVDFRGDDVDAVTALERLGLPRLELAPKEGLAMVNGTAATTGIAALCVHDARAQLAMTLAVHGLAIQALGASLQPFDQFIHRHKPHPGQLWTARSMRQLLAGSKLTRDHDDAAHGTDTCEPVQDRYSVRCLPQFVGPIADGLRTIADQVETEINSTTDNPLIDVDGDAVLHGGNFLAQYVGIGMDQLRHYLGLLAKHLDAQIAVLVTPAFSGGLPPSLVGNTSRRVNMGLKGLQITANSIMPLLGFFGSPLVDRFPTHAEQFNQNINSLGFGAARLAHESIRMFRHYLAIALIFGLQAVDLRTRAVAGHYDARTHLSPATATLYETARTVLERPPDRHRSLIWDNHDEPLDELIDRLVDDLHPGGRIATVLEPLQLDATSYAPVPTTFDGDAVSDRRTSQLASRQQPVVNV